MKGVLIIAGILRFITATYSVSFPVKEGLRSHAVLQAQIADRSTGLGLAEGVENLLLGKLRPLH